MAQKAQEIGYYSELILAARRLNDSMGAFVASQVVKLMIDKDIKIKGAKVLNLGITFKENCPDIRNSKAIDVIHSLEEYGLDVTTFDPWINDKEISKQYKVNCCSASEIKSQKFDAIILTVSHQEFLDLELNNLLKENGVIYDVKGVLPKSEVDKRL